MSPGFFSWFEVEGKAPIQLLLVSSVWLIQDCSIFRWVLLSSCFSHSGSSHILFNMMTLYFMASPVISILGNTGFLTLYFVGVSSFLPNVRTSETYTDLSLFPVCLSGNRFFRILTPLPQIRRQVPKQILHFPRKFTLPAFSLPSQTDSGSQGASGSIYAMLVFFACAMPNTTFLIFFVIPAPAWVSRTTLLS